MALPYVPTTWKSGDLVSSARLNKLEGGVKENSDAILENTADVSQLKSAINANTKIDNSILDIKSNYITGIPLIWENGFIDGTTGENIPRAKNRRCVGYIPTFGKIVRMKTDGEVVAAYFFEYDENLDYLEAHGTTANYISPVNPNTKYVRIATFSETVAPAEQDQHVEAFWANPQTNSENQFSYTPYYIGGNGKISIANNNKQSLIIKVEPGQKIIIKNGVRSNIAFLKSWNYIYAPSPESNADFCEGYAGIIGISIPNYEYVVNAPYDCYYLYVYIGSADGPSSLVIDQYDYINKQAIGESDYVSFPLAGFELADGGKTLRTSVMQKPTLDSDCSLTMVCPSEYKMWIRHISVNLSQSAESVKYSTFNGNAPGLNSNYPNYLVCIEKTDGTDFALEDVTAVKELVNNSFIYINTNKTIFDITKEQRIAEYNSAIRDAVIKTNVDNIPEQKGKNASPLFLHFSDIHGDSERLRRIYKYADEIGADAIINTGDTVVENATNSAKFAQDLDNGYSVPVYVAVGNHDASELASYSAEYEHNVKYYAEKYGYDESELPYYCVDLPTWKIRLITLCQYNTNGAVPEFSQEQLNWLISTLQNVPAGYGVVMLGHAAYKWPNGGIIEGFTQTDALGYPWYGSYENIGNIVLPLVSAFIKRTTVSVSQSFGGIMVSATADFSEVPSTAEFICHIHGHAHRDVVGYYMQDNVKQLTIGIDCATAHSGDASSYTYSFCSELARRFDNEQQDLFNLIGFDRVRKYVKVCRVGASLGINMRTRNPIIAQYHFSE